MAKAAFDLKTRTLLWPTQAKEAIFLARRKRFFADFQFANSSSVEVAHLANTGSLKGVLQDSGLGTFSKQTCLVLPAGDPDRKLKWTLVALSRPEPDVHSPSKGKGPSADQEQPPSERTWIGVHTPLPNLLVKELMLGQALLPEIQSYKSEHKLNAQTRLDGLAVDLKGEEIFVEIKNVTFSQFEVPSRTDSGELELFPRAEFPDCVTERGQKHLLEMISLLKEGKKTLLIFVVQREDCRSFSAAKSLDPRYAELFRFYLKEGGQALALSCRVSPQGVQFTETLPVIFS